MPITTPEQLALATRVRNHVKARPEQHDQGEWYRRQRDCGTTACIAGWTCILDGSELLIETDDYGLIADSVRTQSGYTEDVADHAQRTLGLTEEETKKLFYVGETKAIRYLEQLIADAETRLSGASV